MKNPIKVCMIAYSTYTGDARIKSYVKILNQHGVHVDLLVLEDSVQKGTQINENTRIFRLCEKYRGSNPVLYILSYIYFLIASFFKVSRLFLKERYTVIHVHNMPNFLVFSCIFPRLKGARILLDIHDLMVPIYMVKFNVDRHHWVTRLLMLEQRISANLASHVLCADHLQKEALSREYGIPAEKITVVMNLPHEDIFKRITVEKDPETFNLIYHGTIAKRLGIDLMLQAVSKIRNSIPLRLSVYGNGDFLPMVIALQKNLGLEDVVYISGNTVPVEKLSEIICHMDVGIIANRRNPATDRFMMPVKLMEYAYLKIPVIAPRLTIIQHYFKEDMVKYYEPENVDELSQCILNLFHNKEERKEFAERAVTFFDIHNSKTKSETYLRIIYDGLPHTERHLVET